MFTVISVVTEIIDNKYHLSNFFLPLNNAYKSGTENISVSATSETESAYDSYAVFTPNHGPFPGHAAGHTCW